jgi:hypothetical protein
MAVIYKKTAQPNKPRELFLQVLREQLAVAHDKAEAAPY